MWIMTNKAFLSVVDKSTQPGCLLVRARRREHLKAVFPDAKVRESFGTDYRYRADIPRSEVGAVIAKQIEGIDYTNFKDSVAERKYHDALMGVWHEMADLQPGGPYARRGGQRGGGRRYARNAQDRYAYANGSFSDDDYLFEGFGG